MNILNLRICTFRYALGRKTTVVHDTVEELIDNWAEMSYFQKQIHDDIIHHLKVDRSDIYAIEWQKILDLEITYNRGNI